MGLRSTSRRAVRDGAVIAVAMGVMNLTTYGFVIVAARVLGPAEYGALGAVMGLLLVVNVLSLGLQATAARRVSAAPEDLGRIEGEVLRTSYLSAVVLGVLVLALSPLITRLLDLDSWVVAALVALTAMPLTVMGGQAGLLQGEQRWAPLAAVYLAVGLGRIGFGAVGLFLGHDTLGAMAGVAVGAFAPALIGWAALRAPERQRAKRSLRPPVATEPSGTATDGARPDRWWGPGGVLRETAHNSHALLAFFALSNADVVIARSSLDKHQAGLYAAGLILSKAVLFLPQFVVVIAFPSMSRRGAGRQLHLLSLAAVLGIGAVTTAGVAVLSGLAVLFVGGPQYADLQGRLWVFAALGTLLAMLQLMVYNLVARQRQRAVLLVWAALVVLVVAAQLADSLSTLVLVVVCVDAALFLVLLGRSLAPAYDDRDREPITVGG